MKKQLKNVSFTFADESGYEYVIGVSSGSDSGIMFPSDVFIPKSLINLIAQCIEYMEKENV